MRATPFIPDAQEFETRELQKLGVLGSPQFQSYRMQESPRLYLPPGAIGRLRSAVLHVCAVFSEPSGGNK
eukprot:5252478-Alexandrium_andersonii.AAC.1